jgi:hypothetical protein
LQRSCAQQANAGPAAGLVVLRCRLIHSSICTLSFASQFGGCSAVPTPSTAAEQTKHQHIIGSDGLSLQVASRCRLMEASRPTRHHGQLLWPFRQQVGVTVLCCAASRTTVLCCAVLQCSAACGYLCLASRSGTLLVGFLRATLSPDAVLSLLMGNMPLLLWRTRPDATHPLLSHVCLGHT